MDREIAIRIKDVSKVYKLYPGNKARFLDTFGLARGKTLYTPHYALNKVNLDIFKGETVGIIGTNGSGKSTLLKIITGVLNATEGDVTVDGRISALLELGAGFNMEYNGIENIYLNGTMTGFSKQEIDERLPEILEFAGIGDYVYQPVKTYSSGMFVRLAFALAINIDPEILIVDEALSVGDVFFQSKCYHKFEEFKEAGKTIIFVSHDLSSVAKYCDRVMVLNKGVKLEEGPALDMIDVYKRVLVGQYSDQGFDGSEVSVKEREGLNEETLEYGSGEGHITEVYITDDHGLRTNAVIKGAEFSVHMKVHFDKPVKEPIFAFTIKDVKGTEITGTNTMVERAFTEDVSAGQEVLVSFTQRADLQGGEYLLSFGLTGFKLEEFTVYHRLYNAISFTVISEKNTVGYYDMNSKIEVSVK